MAFVVCLVEISRLTRADFVEDFVW